MSRKTNYSRFSEENYTEQPIENFDAPVEDAGQVDEPSKVETPEPVTRSGKIVNCEMVNVRSKASLDSPVASIILKNEVVKIFGEEGDFYIITTDHNIDGYIMKHYVSVI